MFKKVRPVVFIIWAHLFAFSMFLLISDFGGSSAEFIPDNAKLEKTYFSPDSLMQIKMFKGKDEADIYSLTYKFMNKDDKPLLRISSLPKIDSVKISSEKCLVYTGKIAFEEFRLASMVKGEITPVYYTNGEPGTGDINWFSLSKIGGFITFLLSMGMLYVIYAETRGE